MPLISGVPTEHRDVKHSVCEGSAVTSELTWMVLEHGSMRTSTELETIFKKGTESLTTLPVPQHLSSGAGFRAVCRPRRFLGEFVLRAAEVHVEMLSVYGLAQSSHGLLQTLL